MFSLFQIYAVVLNLGKKVTIIFYNNCLQSNKNPHFFTSKPMRQYTVQYAYQTNRQNLLEIALCTKKRHYEFF